MNEDLARSSNPKALANLTSPPTGLRLTTPTNLVSGEELTISIRTSLFNRYDYVLPGPLMFSNIVGGEIFRTDLLSNRPPNLFSNDDATASDHLPVLMTFANPFNTPFRLLGIARTNQSLTLKWESQNNRSYRIESSSNLFSWTAFATNLTTSTTNSPFAFATNNVSDTIKFFRIYRVP